MLDDRPKSEVVDDLKRAGWNIVERKESEDKDGQQKKYGGYERVQPPADKKDLFLAKYMGTYLKLNVFTPLLVALTLAQRRLLKSAAYIDK